MSAEVETFRPAPSPEQVRQRLMAVFEQTVASIATSSQPIAQYGIALGVAGALQVCELITKGHYAALIEVAAIQLRHASE